MLQGDAPTRLKLKLCLRFFNPDEDFEADLLKEMLTLLCFKRKKQSDHGSSGDRVWEAKPRKKGWVAVNATL